MNKSLVLLLPVIITFIFVPTLAYATALSDLTAATTTNTINNGNSEQIWNWNTLTGTGFFLSSNSTTANGLQVLFSSQLNGVNSNSNISSIAGYITNTHSGTNSTNYGVYGLAASGSHNYGVYGEINSSATGDSGVWGQSLHAGGINYGVYGSDASSAGYAGYFNNTGGGYSAAFLGGNVGIGTAIPQSLAHIYGGEVQVGSSGVSCSAVKGGAIRFSGSTLYYCDGTSTWQTVGGGGSGTAGQVAYYQSTGTTVIGTSTLNIVGGNVGIGTATPVSKLDLVFAGDTRFAIRDIADSVVGNFGANAGGIFFTNEGNGPLAFYTSGNERLHVAGGGNVGIATASPSYTLHVNGSVAGASAYVNLSDVRHKKNIEPLQVGLKEIGQLKPVTFDWKHPKDGGMKGRQIGFIAQDVEKVLPSVVLTADDAEKTKSMKYTEIIPVLAKAIQELKADDDNQAKVIDALRHDFDVYKKSHP